MMRSSSLVENSIMKLLGFSVIYSSILRIFCAFLACFFYKILFFKENLKENIKVSKVISLKISTSFLNTLFLSLKKVFILSFKIIALITIIILFLEILKKFLFKRKNVSLETSILVGMILGITYGASVLLKERKFLTEKQIFFVGTFLMIAHALIEDPMLFAMFGANIFILIFLRVILAFIMAFVLTQFLFEKIKTFKFFKVH